MLRDWQAFQAEQTDQAVLQLQPRARVNAFDTEQLDPKWMTSLLGDWLRVWEGDFTPRKIKKLR